MDHSQCTVTTTTQWEQHDCPPCPHGLLRGGTFTLTGNERIDQMQRLLKLQAIEEVTCESPGHAETLASIGDNMTQQKFVTNDGIEHDIPYGDRVPTHEDLKAITAFIAVAPFNPENDGLVHQVFRSYAKQFKGASE